MKKTIDTKLGGKHNPQYFAEGVTKESLLPEVRKINAGLAAKYEQLMKLRDEINEALSKVNGCTVRAHSYLHNDKIKTK